MFDFIKLIRLPNLILLFIIQYAVRHFILLDAAISLQENLMMNTALYYKMICSTILIAAGGYIINDIYDQTRDAINKPDKVIIGTILPEKSAYVVYYMINTIAILLIINYLPIVVLHAVCISLLYLYAYWGKRQFALGTVLVSLLCIVPIIEVFYWEDYLFTHHATAQYYLFLLTCFCFFVFQATLLREIIKDIEDIEGDIASNCRTFPIVWGIQKTKWLLGILVVLLLLQLAYFNTYLWKNAYHYTALYVAIVLMLPLFVLVAYIYNAKEKADYQRLSLAMKIYFVLGTIFLFVYNY